LLFVCALERSGAKYIQPSWVLVGVGVEEPTFVVLQVENGEGEDVNDSPDTEDICSSVSPVCIP